MSVTDTLFKSEMEGPPLDFIQARLAPEKTQIFLDKLNYFQIEGAQIFQLSSLPCAARFIFHPERRD